MALGTSFALFDGVTMQQFIEAENVRLFQKLLAEERDELSRRIIQSLLAASQRNLALINAAAAGASPVATPLRPAQIRGASAQRAISRFQQEFEASPRPYLVLDPGPGLHIIDINDAYASATMIGRQAVAGARIFDVFPDNPDDPTATGVSKLYASLQMAAATGKPHAMEIQRYDVRDPSGNFVERYWRPLNTPICSDNGELIYLLHHVVDVTSEVLGKPTLVRELALAD